MLLRDALRPIFGVCADHVDDAEIWGSVALICSRDFPDAISLPFKLNRQRAPFRF